MSALPPKADMCSAIVHVRFVPIADIAKLADSFAEAEIRSIELIVQPGAKDAVGEVAAPGD
jgi:hypothetical protein